MCFNCRFFYWDHNTFIAIPGELNHPTQTLYQSRSDGQEFTDLEGDYPGQPPTWRCTRSFKKVFRKRNSGAWNIGLQQ